MKIKVAPILYRAVYEGVALGLQTALEESKRPENEGNPEVLKEVVSSVVWQHLLTVLDLDEELTRMQQEVKSAE